MTVDTQNLRHAAASVRAFLRPEYGREIAAAADMIDAQAAEIERLTARCDARGEQIERKDAEIARMREALEEVLAKKGARWHPTDAVAQKARAALSTQTEQREAC